MTGVRAAAEFRAEEAIRLAGVGDRAEFMARVVDPIVAAHGVDALAELVLSTAGLAHLATQYLAHDKGLSIDAVLDLYAAGRHRRPEPDGSAT